MPSLHWPDLLILVALGIIVFGPKRLPEMGAALGKTIREFQKSMREVTNPDASSSLPQSPTATVTPVPPAAPTGPAIQMPAEPVTPAMAAPAATPSVEPAPEPAAQVIEVAPASERPIEPATPATDASVDAGATH